MPKEIVEGEGLLGGLIIDTDKPEPPLRRLPPDPGAFEHTLNLIELGGSGSAVKVGLRRFEIAHHLGVDVRERPREAVPPEMLDRDRSD